MSRATVARGVPCGKNRRRGGRQGQGAGAGVVGLVGEGAGVQHGAPRVEHGGVGGDLVVVFGAEPGAKQACGEATHGADRPAGADRAEPHDPRRVRGDDGACAGGEGARLVLGSRRPGRRRRRSPGRSRRRPKPRRARRPGGWSGARRRAGPRGPGSRTRASTWWPRSSAWATRWRPVPPVAPRTVTRIQFTSAEGLDHRGVHTRGGHQHRAGRAGSTASRRWR